MVNLLGSIIPTPHDITVEPTLGDGPNGPRWGDPVTYQGRWETHTEHVQIEDGRVVTMRAKVYLPAAADPSPGARVTYRGETYWAQKVDTPVWVDGTPMHHEVRVT